VGVAADPYRHRLKGAAVAQDNAHDALVAFWRKSEEVMAGELAAPPPDDWEAHMVAVALRAGLLEDEA
jgi:hypothetical protein